VAAVTVALPRSVAAEAAEDLVAAVAPWVRDAAWAPFRVLALIQAPSTASKTIRLIGHKPLELALMVAAVVVREAFLPLAVALRAAADLVALQVVQTSAALREAAVFHRLQLPEP
jgi:hypothetical protein